MKVVNIPINLINEDLEQPRTNFDDNSIEELAESIQKVGLLTPIKVRPLSNGKFKIIFGNRRYKACNKLNIIEIPCIISENEDEIDIYLEQLTENIQRESFTPIEEALAFKKILDEYNWSKKMLSGQLGKSEGYISKKLDLLTFGNKVKGLIHSGTRIIPDRLNEEQVLKLKKIPIEYRDHVALKVAKDELSVNDAEKVAQLFTDKTISSDMKEKLLGLTCSDMVMIWAEKQIKDTKLFNQINNPKPIIVNNQASNLIPVEEKLIEEYVYKASQLQEKLEILILKIPTYNPLSIDIQFEVNNMSLETRERFNDSIGILVNTLESYLEDWLKIKNLIDKKMDIKNNIKLIK